MKKRVIALLCLLALCLTLLPFALGADAYEGIYLVGVNDTVLLNLINDTYMPVRRLGIIYAPYTILDNKELGLSYALNKTDGTFTVFNREKTLIFYTNGDGCYDKKGNAYSDRVFFRNSNVYLPLRFLASFFDLTYSYYNIPMKEGIIPIARLRSDRSQLTDGQFGTAVAQLAAQPVAQYVASHTTPAPSASATTSAPVPTLTPAPTPSPSRPPTVISPVSPSPSPSAAPSKSLSFSLAITAGEGSGFSDLLSTLSQNRLTALILFSPDDLIARDEDVRQAAAQGHQIGLLLGEENPEEDFRRGNQLLAHLLHSETVQVAFPGGGEVEGEWWIWRGNVTARGSSAQTQAENLLTDLENRSFARVTLSDSTRSAQALRLLLSSLKGRSYTYRVPTETT